MLAVLGALFANGLITVSSLCCCYDGHVRNDGRVAALVGRHHKPGVFAPNVVKVVELLTMHLAPKQILINAHVNLRGDLVLGDVLQTNEEIEALIKSANPKVEMIFLETARASDSTLQNVVPEHMA